MPKAKKKKPNIIEYVSMADFYSNIDDYKTLDGKLDYATKYIKLRQRKTIGHRRLKIRAWLMIM